MLRVSEMDECRERFSDDVVTSHLGYFWHIYSVSGTYWLFLLHITRDSWGAKTLSENRPTQKKQNETTSRAVQSGHGPGYDRSVCILARARQRARSKAKDRAAFGRGATDHGTNALLEASGT